MRDMQTCKFLNLSEVAEMPIGRLVEQTFHEIVEKNLLSEEQVKFLTDKDFCKEQLGLYFPLLKEVDETKPIAVQRKINNYDRYYATPVNIGDKKYLICNDLYEKNHKPYLEWLATLK